MASFIIEQLKATCDDSDSLGLAYYYCHFSHKEDEGVSFLSWIIGQFCSQAKWAPHRLERLRISGCDPSIEDLEPLLEATLARFRAVHVVVDAVDESEPRSDLLSVLKTLATDERFAKIRLLATSRIHPDIESCFSNISTAISMSNPFVEEDIRTVVCAWVTSSPAMKRWSHMTQFIEDTLCTGAHGMCVLLPGPAQPLFH